MLYSLKCQVVPLLELLNDYHFEGSFGCSKFNFFTAPEFAPFGFGFFSGLRGFRKKKKLVKHSFYEFLCWIGIFGAVRGGFEPPVQFPVRQFSKLVVSATHPPHRYGFAPKRLLYRNGKDNYYLISAKQFDHPLPFSYCGYNLYCYFNGRFYFI